MLTGAATERTHHSLSQAGPRHGPSPMQTHRGQVRGSQTGMCADEDASPDTTTPADMKNARPDAGGHTCLYTHLHTESPPDTYTRTSQSHSQTEAQIDTDVHTNIHTQVTQIDTHQMYTHT